MPMTRTEKYLHRVTKNSPCKWMSIGLANLAAEMSHDELVALLPEAQSAVMERATKQLNRLIGLEAPAVILDNCRDTLAKAASGKHEHVVIIRRQIAKLERSNQNANT